MNNEIILPVRDNSKLPSISEILSTMNLPREIIAPENEIDYAWKELPRELSRIPVNLRDELIARMCIATSVGLFDSAINYSWNAVIQSLRKQIRNFGLNEVATILNKSFEEKNLLEIRDSELLDLSRNLDLLTEEGHFYLHQCREMRNSFSVAHPCIAQIDDRELINFISRCCKHGISENYELMGIHITDFIKNIKDNDLNSDAITICIDKLSNTFPSQRTLLLLNLHGIYCDASSKQQARVNALEICRKSLHLFDDKIKSELINRHSNYIIKNKDESLKASRIFFEQMGLIELLTDSEKHSIFSKAVDNLYSAHIEYNNFYNEPPFAERLYELSEKNEIPKSAKQEYVSTVIACYIGNAYGISNMAVQYYEKLIRNFKPLEINVFLNLLNEKNLVSDRMQNSRCKKKVFRCSRFN